MVYIRQHLRYRFVELRRYLLGSELDAAMHYPLRAGVHDFLLGRIDAYGLAETVYALWENYPPTAIYGAFNLMGSHDRARMMTIMGDTPDADALSEAERRAYRLCAGGLSGRLRHRPRLHA